MSLEINLSRLNLVQNQINKPQEIVETEESISIPQSAR